MAVVWSTSVCVIERMIASLSVRWRQQRQVLADLDAGHVRGDRLELAADLAGRVGLQVPGVLLGRPAPHEQQDARLRPPEATRSFLASGMGRRPAGE